MLLLAKWVVVLESTDLSSPIFAEPWNPFETHKKRSEKMKRILNWWMVRFGGVAHTSEILEGEKTTPI